MAQLASIPSLVMLPYLLSATHFAVHSLSFRNRLGKGPFSEPKWKFWSWFAAALMWTIIAFKEALADSQPELQLSDGGRCGNLVEDVAVDKAEVQQMEENPFPPFH